MMVQTGAADCVLAGGVESMSNIEYYTTALRGGARAGNVAFYDRLERGRERSQPVERFGVISGMIETAENVARECAITREASDVYAADSHARAAAAWARGDFDAEVVPISVPQRKGDPVVVARDEGFRPDATVDSLAKLRPLMKDGVVTAGNASQQNDAAAACLVVAEDQLEALGLTPMATLVGWAPAGCHPATMGLGPVPAVEKLLKRTGLTLEDMGLIELNEAFACQVLGVMKGLGIEGTERLNIQARGSPLVPYWRDGGADHDHATSRHGASRRPLAQNHVRGRRAGLLPFLRRAEPRRPSPDFQGQDATLGALRTLLRWAGDGASPNTRLVKIPGLREGPLPGAFVEEGAGHDVNDFLPL